MPLEDHENGNTGRDPASSHPDRSSPSDARRLAVALGLIGAFMVAEVAAAVLSHSLALLADSGHMLTDAGAIGGSLWAMHLSSRPATPRWSYGLKRAEILAAAVNGVTLLVMGALLLAGSIQRLVHPVHPRGSTMVIVGACGIAVNVAATWVMSRADRSSLNVEGAFRHIATDLFGFAGTVAAGIVIVATGWGRADPIASLVVVVLIFLAAAHLLVASGHVLLEGTPDSVDLDEVRRHLCELPEVVSVHDVHAWTLTSSLPALTAHVVITPECIAGGDVGRVLDHLQRCLADHFDVEHSTFQLEAVTHAEHERGAHD